MAQRVWEKGFCVRICGVVVGEKVVFESRIVSLADPNPQSKTPVRTLLDFVIIKPAEKKATSEHEHGQHSTRLSAITYRPHQ